MLRMDRIRKVYRTDHVETHALSEFNLEVQEGEFVAVMGPSGSGKTTFLTIAGLLDTFDEGSYTLDGDDVSQLSDTRMSRIRNEKIGFIFQSFNLIPDLNVFDNVDVPLRYRGLRSAARRQAIEEALGTVGLTARMRHLPSQLSGGQQQRVAIARALVGQPRLILADEPTGNLDSAMANDILDLLENINSTGTTVVMVTHDPELANRASRQIHLLDGKLIDIAQDRPVPLYDPLRSRPASNPSPA
jgi:putative ABC transport system ATP-binding protein